MGNAVNNTNIARVEEVDAEMNEMQPEEAQAVIMEANEETLENIISYISDHPEANVNAPRFLDNKTLLHVIVDRDETVQDNDCLLDDLVNLPYINYNVQDGQGKTPLHYSVDRKDSYILELLIGNGAKADIRDNRGYSAFDYAIFNNAHDIIEVMLRKGVLLDIHVEVHNEKTSSLIEAAYFADRVYMNLITPTEADYRKHAQYVV
ncbi:Ankyrin repeat protein [Rickettsiales bacterium Ac37b]|nr:Ankyrin repeat protein [Rickettsiales bacterium Ac37b]